MGESIQDAAEATLREWAGQRTELSVHGPEDPQDHLRRLLVRGLLDERDTLRKQVDDLHHLVFATTTAINDRLAPEDGDPVSAERVVERVAKAVLHVYDALDGCQQFVHRYAWVSALSGDETPEGGSDAR